jgi:hypothetical protein
MRKKEGTFMPTDPNTLVFRLADAEVFRIFFTIDKPAWIDLIETDAPTTSILVYPYQYRHDVFFDMYAPHIGRDRYTSLEDAVNAVSRHNQTGPYRYLLATVREQLDSYLGFSAIRMPVPAECPVQTVAIIRVLVSDLDWIQNRLASGMLLMDAGQTWESYQNAYASMMIWHQAGVPSYR